MNGSNWNRRPQSAASGHTAADAHPVTDQHNLSYSAYLNDRPSASDRDHARYRANRAASYRGLGPRNVPPSDQRLLEDVCERLSDAPDIDASDISVYCEKGAVRLEGSVENRTIKFRVEDEVARCRGVQDIENRLRVNTPSHRLYQEQQISQGEKRSSSRRQ